MANQLVIKHIEKAIEKVNQAILNGHTVAFPMPLLVDIVNGHLVPALQTLKLESPPVALYEGSKESHAKGQLPIDSCIAPSQYHNSDAP